MVFGKQKLGCRPHTPGSQMVDVCIKISVSQLRKTVSVPDTTEAVRRCPTVPSTAPVRRRRPLPIPGHNLLWRCPPSPLTLCPRGRDRRPRATNIPTRYPPSSTENSPTASERRLLTMLRRPREMEVDHKLHVRACTPLYRMPL